MPLLHPKRLMFSNERNVRLFTRKRSLKCEKSKSFISQTNVGNFKNA